MSTTQEVLTVEALTQYGVKAAGRNYNISPKLKEAGITPQHFGVGVSYQVEVYTGPKGGKSINSFGAINTAANPLVSAGTLPPPPALPPTTVTGTKAPGGVPPVTPAQSRNGSDDDKMTKADWAKKDENIGIDAVIKSTLESPALAQMVVGKNEVEAFDLSRRYVRFNLETQRLAKAGSL